MTEKPTIGLRRYIAGDVQLITPRAAVAHEAAAHDATLMARGTPPGLAWTVQVAGAPIGCGGLFECWKGRWLAWTWVGEVPIAARKFVATACRGGVETVIRDHGARRIESHVPITMPLARRFNERLGFQVEAVARAFGPDGSDYWAMALIVEEARRGH